MSEGSDNAEKSTEEYGSTDGDIAQMAAYLRRPMHTRRNDDRRRSSEK